MATPQPAQFDINAFIAAMQQQNAQQLAYKQNRDVDQSALGRVATSNSRPQGLTEQSAWERMFPTRPGGSAGPAGDPAYAPPTMSPADAAVAASPAAFSPSAGPLPAMADPAMATQQNPEAMLAFNRSFAANPSAMTQPQQPRFTPPPAAVARTNPMPMRPYRPSFAFGAGVPGAR